jgi:hypothetical protein
MENFLRVMLVAGLLLGFSPARAFGGAGGVGLVAFSSAPLGAQLRRARSSRHRLPGVYFALATASLSPAVYQRGT